MYTVEEYEHAGIPVRIVHDEDAENPYYAFDQASELLYSGDYDFKCKPVPAFGSWYRDEPSSAIMARWLTLFGGYALAIPWHLADYGSNGLQVWLHDPDDDPASGFVVMTQATINKEWGGEREKAEACARAEFETFCNYVEQDVYGFIVAEGTEDEDPCFGFYGSLDGHYSGREVPYVMQEANAVAECIAEERARLRSLPWLPTFGSPITYEWRTASYPNTMFGFAHPITKRTA